MNCEAAGGAKAPARLCLSALSREIPRTVIRSLSLAVVLLLGRLTSIVAQSPAAVESSAVVVAGSDTLLVAASQAIAQGLPYRASRMLDPVLRDSARRTPEALLLAAMAASRWGGWAEVARLLEGSGWSDARLRGPALLLAARAAVELGRDTVAGKHAQSHLACCLRRGRDFLQIGRPGAASPPFGVLSRIDLDLRRMQPVTVPDLFEIGVDENRDSDAGVEELLRVLWQTYLPNRVIACATKTADQAAAAIPFLRGRSDARLPTAFVCYDGTCQLPATQPAEFALQLAARS